MYKVPIFNCFSEGPYMHVKHSLAYLEIHENFPINNIVFNILQYTFTIGT